MQAFDARRHLVLVKFGEVRDFPVRPGEKYRGHQNVSVRLHRDAMTEHGKYFLRAATDAVTKDHVYQC